MMRSRLKVTGACRWKSARAILYVTIFSYVTINEKEHAQMQKNLFQFKSNRKAMNRNWSNQKANPALKTKAGNKRKVY